MPAQSSRNRRILLVNRPVGIPQPSDFAFDETGLVPLEDGQFLVRNCFLSVDPAQRGWANEGANYSNPVPLGSVMRALAVGEIVESRHAEYPVGHHVYGWLGWQDYAIASPKHVLTRIAAPRLPLSAYAGVLGINGLTAHLALHGIGRPKAGDTVLVSTAAGAVGSVVGQLARAAGCTTIGLSSDPAKLAMCRDRFGYDHAINYREPGLEEAISRVAPDGIDVFFDNVGGEQLDKMLRKMRVGGRVVQCGTASVPSWTPPPTGLRNERELLMRRLTWGGFVVFDHMAVFEETMHALGAMIEDGSLVYDEDVREGIACAPQALVDVFAGRNRGKVLISP
ncbi:NADP-dependent oxidoreductase [Novosphingobium indicum]|uniref:NADP-dependent oxidoreductase n=1 Tax=Novosphingobium indicum TaxID=462949 RepID=A0ABQ2K2B6_9SPHN|nr:NADP-dependent oxidoreductase [Novosphingobium indicum]GGN61749.1 NADP-dependent oxidoreductase [Novosphingobium indicum]